MSTVQIFQIDFDHLEKLDDLRVVPGTPEDVKAVSEFLKTYKARQARAKSAKPLRQHVRSSRKKAK